MSPNGQQPQYIMDDVKLLFNDVTKPESGVAFNPPTRANLATIQSNINPPAITWTWADQSARLAQVVTQSDTGKYGIQSDANKRQALGQRDSTARVFTRSPPTEMKQTSSLYRFTLKRNRMQRHYLAKWDSKCSLADRTGTGF
jgi:hypothetical protein